MIKDAPGTVVTYLKALEKKGYIRLPKKKSQKRAIRVISPVETRRFEFPLLGRVFEVLLMRCD